MHFDHMFDEIIRLYIYTHIATMYYDNEAPSKEWI